MVSHRLKFLRNKFTLILLLGLVLRLIAITTRPIWYDEAFSVLFSSTGPRGMVYGTLGSDPTGGSAEEHPLGYYVLLWGWMKLFGGSVLAVRSLSVLFGLGIVTLSYFLTKQFLDEKTGQLAAFLVAISPFQIHYAQEVRMYVQLSLLLVGCTFCLYKAINTIDDKNTWRWWTLFSVLAAGSQYTHNLAAIYLVPLALIPVLTRKPKAVRNVILAGIGAMLVYSPWMIHLPDQFTKLQTSYWISKPGILQIFNSLLIFVTNLPLPGEWLYLGLSLTLIIFFFACWQTYKTYRRKANGYRRGLLMVYLTFSPPALLFLVSQWKPIFVERVLLTSGVFFLIWMAWVLTSTEMPRLLKTMTTALLFIGASMGIFQNATFRGFPYGPFDQMGETLSSVVSTGDVVVHSNKLTMLPSFYYHPDLPHEYITDPPGSGSNTLGIPTQESLGLMASPSIEEAVGEATRVWFIIFPKAIEEYQVLGEDTHPHLEWLDTHYQLKRTEEWGSILLYIYELKPDK
jgi:4-amino-4-deoxy-L-arabinose transferase-like glycosyltransferase